MTGTLCKLCGKIIIAEDPHQFDHDFTDHMEQDHPDVMSVVSDSSPDEWKWHIELRLNNSISSTNSIKMKQINNESPEIA